MPNPEPRYPCPVCLGVQMAKQQIGPSSELILDHCQRCGGIWFDYGEVQGLRHCRPQALWQQIDARQEAYRMQCHVCYAYIERNATACPLCGWQNVIDCPVCDHALQPITYDALKLDLCKRCKGIWFDHIELSAIWNLELSKLGKRRQGTPDAPSSAEDHNSLFLLEALSWGPDLAFYNAEAIVHSGQTLITGSAEVLQQTPEAAGSMIEATGELAGSVFETIAQIITDLLSP